MWAIKNTQYSKYVSIDGRDCLTCNLRYAVKYETFEEAQANTRSNEQAVKI